MFVGHKDFSRRSVNPAFNIVELFDAPDCDFEREGYSKLSGAIMKSILSSTVTRLGSIATIVVLAGTLGACSASSDPVSNSDKPKAAAMTLEEWQVKYDDCLVDHGITPPKESTDGSLQIDMDANDQEEYMKASESCTKKIGDAPTREGALSTKESDEALLKAIDCLRDRGHKIDDPKSGALSMPDGVSPEEITACFKK